MIIYLALLIVFGNINFWVPVAKYFVQVLVVFFLSFFTFSWIVNLAFAFELFFREISSFSKLDGAFEVVTKESDDGSPSNINIRGTDN